MTLPFCYYFWRKLDAEIGFGFRARGYFRARWELRTNVGHDYEPIAVFSIGGWADAYTGPNLENWYWHPARGIYVGFRHYRRIATHFTIGKLSFSWVQDREKMGPIGPVYPARKCQKIHAH